MKGFIVWDANDKCFYDGGMIGINVFKLNQDGTLSYYDGCYDDDYANKFYTPFENIGLKDINKKSIYADSSVVEMYMGLDSFIGYYTYNKNKAHYEFIIIDGCDNDSFGNIIGSSLKIIDTIQENKLGLVK